uniref:Uncharacterized protein n=1 Tax=Ascaris lumbricoides TaxID=6252 RepID=A0A0M3I6C1_ASCLU
MRQGEAAAEMEPQPLAGRRKRRYDTEEARRADICAAYLKRFKTIAIICSSHFGSSRAAFPNAAVVISGNVIGAHDVRLL